MNRLRRDPRGECAATIVSRTPRIRIDRAHRGGAGDITMAAAPQPQPITIATPAFLVFAVVEAVDGILSRHDRQVIGAARLLDAGGTAAIVALATVPVDAPGEAGADRLMVLTTTQNPEAHAAVLVQAINHHQPRHVIFPETTDGGDLARRIAAITDLPLFTDTESLSSRLAIRAAEARHVEWRTAPPCLIAIAADMIAPWNGLSHVVQPLAAPAPQPHPTAIRTIENLPADSASIPLDQAGFVIAAGNGVADFAAFLDLAAVLGATPGASRVVCDAGSLPRTLQVGASGTVLSADCYIAFGISGAPQHLQGIGAVESVVAINTDLHAAIIARAGLAIVADAQSVMPALRARLSGPVA